MLTKDVIKQVVEFQAKREIKESLIPRETKIDKNSSQVVIVSGVRRCGKSTLLKQSLKSHNNVGHLNLEDPRLKEFTVTDFLRLEEVFKDLGKNNVLFFDEIQNVKEWERYIRSAHDSGKKIFITGSNASMLSRELGTKLTGRYKSIELFPFSYKEFLEFTKTKPNKKSLIEYLKNGGFPEYLRKYDQEYLQNLFKGIIARDIIVRYGIKNEETIMSLALFLLSNVSKVFSYNKTSKLLSIKSIKSTLDYCSYLKEAYLVDFIFKYTPSIRKQIVNPKKVYAVDTGLVVANTLSLSEDFGRLLENAIFLQLRRKKSKIFYFQENSECDFVVLDQGKELTVIQVCLKLTELNLRREINGLKEALEKTKAKRGIIISLDQEDVIDGIKVIPAWKWLLSLDAKLAV